jgi:uncharacterized membrane protein
MSAHVTFVFTIYLCLIAAAMLAAPNMRRGILFGVAVAPDFQRAAAARTAIARFRSIVLSAFAICLAAVWLAPGAVTSITAPAALIIVSVAAFILEHRSLRHIAIAPAAQPRRAEMSTAPDRLPAWIWLDAGPFLILLAAALMLNAHWGDIPARFPVHWGLDGQPNRWRDRTFFGVYGPALLGTELCAWMVIIAIGGWFGARRSPLRAANLAALAWIEYMLAIEFALIALMPLGYFGPPRAAIVLAPVVLIIPALILLIRGSRRGPAPADTTPNECWKGGVIYYNPDDPALFVARRTGIGYTFNFGNRWSWALALGLALIIATTPLIV